ncbi:MAG TPA: tryptophan synthase subunit beta [Steroidobacteraceae bacterium]|nr:tryptophan synthase subunit beta [Steroidobacteraceae bacterium]
MNANIRDTINPAQLLADEIAGKYPDARGRFGPFGGRYIPETLVAAFEKLEAGVKQHLHAPDFQAELAAELMDWVGRPTALSHAPALSKAWGVDVWLKREDLAHTGAHKINNALGQALLARRLGVKRIVAETGAGQHGVATAAACARVGLPCTVYMGAVDMERQAPNVGRMKLLGTTVVPVTSGDRTLRAAIDEAFRDWVANPTDTFYIIGSAVGPHPFPYLVRELQSVIGKEARAQIQERTGKLPDAVVACVGGGSNAIGMFHPFIGDESVEIVGIEAGGKGAALGQNAATLAYGRPGVLHGAYSLLLQDANGQIQETDSVSAGLDYPGVGPEHSLLLWAGRVRYEAATDDEALDALDECCRREGILPAIESAHALAGARRWAKQNPGKSVLIGLSGRGDKDMPTLQRTLLAGGNS